MTGEKDRYTTTEKLWKLDDQLLSTPKHDEMVLWLLNYNNSASILKSLFNSEKPSIRFTWNQYKLYNLNEDKSGFLTDLITNPEAPVNGKYYPDLLNSWEQLHLGYHYSNYLFMSEERVIIEKIQSEVPITANNGFLVGYADIKILLKDTSVYYESFKFSVDKLPPSIYIEVKPTIKSFGETLRQLNTYKHYLQTDDLFLFTTDLRFKDAFESQGIKVITYPVSDK